MSRYQVSVGEEFEIETAEVEVPPSEPSENNPKVIEAKHRNRVSMIVFGFAAFFLLIAGGIGLYEGNFDKLQSVYNVAVIPVSAIVGYYFHKQHPPN